jgi:hypothetical protein
MKKKYYILLTISLIVILVVSFLYRDISENYCNRFKNLETNRISLTYQSPFVNYFRYNFKCPENEKEILKLLKEKDKEAFRQIHLKDPLSRKQNSNIKYIPLYNSDNLNSEGFLILSAGIDGKINFTSNEDSIYIKNFENELPLYNSKNFYQSSDKIRRKPCPDFDILNYFFGKKDYLIGYINCIEIYKQQANLDPLSSNELMQKIKALNDEEKKSVDAKLSDFDYLNTDRIFKFKTVNPIDTVIDKNHFILFSNNEYTFRCQIYDDYKKKYNQENILIGRYKSTNHSKKLIKFVKCLQLE